MTPVLARFAVPLALAAWLAPQLSQAGGFAISEQDASASGRSGTATGVSGTASSVHFNPAGLGAISGVAATAGITAIVPSASAADPDGGPSSSAEGGVKLPPHVYAAYGFGKLLGPGELTVGAGFNAPFGGGLRWPADWRGRTELVSMDLQVLAGHVGAAYRYGAFSFGLAAQIYRVSVELNKRIDFVDSEGKAQLGGAGMGLGASAGIQWQPRSDLQLGLMGRLPSTVTATGRAHFSDIPGAFAPSVPDQAIKASITLPAKLALGADVRLPWFRAVADVEYTFWSSFRSFEIDFEDPATPDVSQPRNWANAPTFRLGLEREVARATLRVGGVLDLAASPSDTLSPSLPDSTRLGFSLGVGYPLGPVRGDLAYQYVAFLPRTSSGEALPARYTASAHLIALSLAWVGSDQSR